MEKKKREYRAIKGKGMYRRGEYRALKRKALLAQSEEHQPSKLRVAGSSPA